MNEIVLAKAALRKQILSQRHDRVLPAADSLTQNILQLVANIQPSRVACYLPFKDEPNTLPAIELLRHQMKVIVPEIASAEELRWLVYPTSEEVQLSSGDLLLIPALAIDFSGNRLGRGKGYFDRVLDKLPSEIKVFAVVFENEVLSHLPVEEHDRLVDGVVTEEQIRELN